MRDIHTIREAADDDWPGIWRIIEPVFREGETYAFATDISESEARQAWMIQPQMTFVADAHGQIMGTYNIKPNFAGPAAHVCNCGYIVDHAAQGRGIASQMCEHSQEVAIQLGFRAMQYNLVVATNQGAIRLWQKHGFDIVGTLPGAYDHSKQGFVDAYVMYKALS